MTELIFIPSNHGNQWILYKQHCFYKWCTRDNGNVYWKCVFSRRRCRKWECKASITTIALNLEIKEENLNYANHPNFSSLDTRLHQCLDSVTKRSRNEYGSINSIFRDEIIRIIEED
ncbi:unnamed protein product [Brachionus calyciflorus]|uniref:FLYWCH-type domain-containing protein n=1 Tax=Brachionus calyciflorus TaxID=104777 RepID=A0A814KHI0_9BILA|nr:unnamed protein product [Brachionus calyciflorus]